MYKFTSNQELKHALQNLQYNSETKEYTSEYGNPYKWDISEVTDMSDLFRDKSNKSVRTSKDYYGLIKTDEDCEKFRFIERWDVSHVTNMKNMFSDCHKFQLYLHNWKVSNVTNMSGMFNNCKNMFHDCGLDNWDVSNVKDMSFMFNGATTFRHDNEVSLNVNIDNWDVSNVEDMTAMFQETINFKRDLSKWNPKSLVDPMKAGYMFYGVKIHPETYKWYEGVLKRLFPKNFGDAKREYMKGTTTMGFFELRKYNEEKRIFDGNKRRGMDIMKTLNQPRAPQPVKPSAPKMTEEEYRQQLNEPIRPSAPEMTEEEYEKNLRETERLMRELTQRPQNLGEYPVIPSMRLRNTIHEEINPNEYRNTTPVLPSISRRDTTSVLPSISGRDTHDNGILPVLPPKPPTSRMTQTRKIPSGPTPIQRRITEFIKSRETMRSSRGNYGLLPDAPTHEPYNLPDIPTGFEEAPKRQLATTRKGGKRRRQKKQQRKTKRRIRRKLL